MAKRQPSKPIRVGPALDNIRETFQAMMLAMSAMKTLVDFADDKSITDATFRDTFRRVVPNIQAADERMNPSDD